MRTLTRSLIGVAVAAAVAAATFVALDQRSGSDRHVDAPRSAGTTAASTTVPTAAPTTVPPTTTTLPPGFPLPADPRPTRIVWAGDSIADTLAAAVAFAAGARGVEVVNMTTSGCGMVRGDPADDNLVPLSFVRGCSASIPGQQVSIAALGGEVVTWLSTWETANRIVDGQAFRFNTPESDAMLLGLIDESVQRLTAGGARLVFLTIPPNAVSPRRPVVTDADVQAAAHLNDLFRQYAAAHADRVSILDLAAIVCPGGHPCPTVVEGVALRPEDGGHFAGDGPAWTAPRVLDKLIGPG